MTKMLNVGKIVNTHGIRGEVRVISKTDFPEKRYAKGNTLYIHMPGASEPIEVTVKTHRVHKNFDLLVFEGLENINEVEKYKGAILKAPESLEDELEEHEFYYHQIIDCEVYSEDDEHIGAVKEILSPGANDVWVVKRRGQKDLLIPYIEAVVKKVDVTNKRITIHVMEGLMD